jgi:hypothetical protein
VAPEGEYGRLAGTTLGGYLLLGLLGYGGMAEVYRAQEPDIERQVAVKVLPARLAQDPGYVRRFRMEARRVAALSHPHVVPLYRFGEERGLLYLVMPIFAESLRDRLEREIRLAPLEALRLAIQVASGLGAAHRRGLVHRDVKPENVLLDEDGRGLLTDFGIARDIESLRDAGVQWTLASTGLPIGTPEYMAPEQLQGLAADQRVDVYALGVVLYEMLTGRVPFDAALPAEVAALVLTQPPVPPSDYNEGVRPELEQVVLRAMAKHPDDRFPDMLAFSQALRRSMLEPAPDPGQLEVAPVGWALGDVESRLAEAEQVYAEGLIEDARARGGDDGPAGAGPSRAPARAPARAMGAVPGARLWGDLRRRRRVPLAAVLALLVVALCAAGGLAALRGRQADAPSAPGAGHDPTATARGATPPALGVSPATLALTAADGVCSGRERLVNAGAAPVRWSWSGLPSAGASSWSFAIDGGARGPDLPTGTLAAGASATVTVTYDPGGGPCDGSAAVITVAAAGGAPARFTIDY